MRDLNIDKVVVCKCESCSGYHPVNECEYVLIKLIKGKKCPLPGSNLNISVKPVETKHEDIIVQESIKSSAVPDAFKTLVSESATQSEVKPVNKDDPAEILKHPDAILRVTPEGKKEYLRRQSGMPPDFRAFLPPGEGGKVITRKV